MKYLGKLFASNRTAQPTFVKLVEAHFGFLVGKYGFTISTKPLRSSSDRFEDGWVEFRTQQTTISVVPARNAETYVDLWPTGEPPITRTSLYEVVQYLSDEKERALDSRGHSQGGNWKLWVESQIIQQADILRKYGDQIFGAGFDWFDLLKYRLERAQRFYQHNSAVASSEAELKRYLDSKSHLGPPIEKV